MLPGEALHRAGEDGARRARRYLESTTRVKSVWLNTDPRHAARMTFEWPHNPQHYSFDIGGLLHGGEFEGDIFLAECKKYTTHRNNQGVEYRSFLAKCYATDERMPGFFNHYMWITWHPFSVSEWSTLTSDEYVKRSVIEESSRVLGVEDSHEAEGRLDKAIVSRVAEKLWIWVLSDKQEKLVITPENRKMIYGEAAGDYTL